MRIGIFDPYLDDLGGGEKYMMTIAQCLSKRHEVWVFWNNYKDIDVLLERFTLDLSRVRFTKNIFTPRVSFFERLLKTRRYDALIVLSDGSIPFCISKKLFIHFQQPVTGINLDIKKRLKISRVTKIFCNSYYTKSYIDKEFGINSLVLYPPVDLKPKNLKKENIILNVGRFRVRNIRIGERAIGDYKKQSVMVDAFKQMVDQGLTTWRFVMAVSVQEKDVHEFEKLKKLAQDYPIEFVVNKSNEDLWSVYSQSKIYWHASGFEENLVVNPEYAEHFGISTVEAMGAGCVPVVIKAGGQTEIVEHGVNGYLWQSIKELQNITKTLIGDLDTWEKMSAQAKVRASFFEERKFYEEIEKMIET